MKNFRNRQARGDRANENTFHHARLKAKEAFDGEEHIAVSVTTKVDHEYDFGPSKVITFDPNDSVVTV